jgi:hypothetical protein
MGTETSFPRKKAAVAWSDHLLRVPCQDFLLYGHDFINACTVLLVFSFLVLSSFPHPVVSLSPSLFLPFICPSYCHSLPFLSSLFFTLRGFMQVLLKDCHSRCETTYLFCCMMRHRSTLSVGHGGQLHHPWAQNKY